MLIAKLRYQGLIIAGLFFLVLLGSFVPDPFVKDARSSPAGTNAVVSVFRYFRFHMKYVAVAPLIRGVIGYYVNSSLTPRVYIGRDHHLYYSEQDVPAQSAGEIYRRPGIVHFADVAAVLQKELHKNGGNLIVAIGPNAQSVATEDLPYKGGRRGPLEYDLALAELAKRSVRTSDVKSALLAYGNGSALYKRTDTHWNNLAALLAFNAVVTDAGHPEWTVSQSVLGAPKAEPGGDLARIMGIQNYLQEPLPPYIAPIDDAWEKRPILRSTNRPGDPFDSYAYDRKELVGERVLVLGDSFTTVYWYPFLRNTPGIARMGWMHHQLCGFDFEDVRAFNPTLVIWIPVERSLGCKPEQWPPGLPKE